MYLQTKWASLMSYDLAVDKLEEVLPLHGSTTTVRRHTREVAEKLAEGLITEEETWLYSIPMMWDQMPELEPLLRVGIDGGYVQARDGDDRKAGWFEVIVVSLKLGPTNALPPPGFQAAYPPTVYRFFVNEPMTGSFSLLDHLLGTCCPLDLSCRVLNQHICRRRGDAIAVVAVARKLLVVIWHLLHNHSIYYHLKPQGSVRKLQDWAWCVGSDHLPAATSAEFVRDRLKSLGLHDMAVALVANRKGNLKVDKMEVLSANGNLANGRRPLALIPV